MSMRMNNLLARNKTPSKELAPVPGPCFLDPVPYQDQELNMLCTDENSPSVANTIPVDSKEAPIKTKQENMTSTAAPPVVVSPKGK